MAKIGNFHPEDSLERSENELNTVWSFTYHNYENDIKNASLMPGLLRI